MQRGSIARYKEESLLYFLTLWVQAALKLHQKPGLTFYWGKGMGL